MSAIQDKYNLGRAFEAYEAVYEGLKKQYEDEYPELDQECGKIDSLEDEWACQTQKYLPSQVDKLNGTDLAKIKCEVMNAAKRMEAAKVKAYELLIFLQKGKTFLFTRPIPIFDVVPDSVKLSNWTKDLMEKEKSVGIIYRNMVKNIPQALAWGNQVIDRVNALELSMLLNCMPQRSHYRKEKTFEEMPVDPHLSDAMDAETSVTMSENVACLDQ